MLRAAALALAVCSLAAGCGGSSSDSQEEPASGTLEALWRAPGPDVAIVPGTADFAPGRVRLTFLVVDDEGRVVTRPPARGRPARAGGGAVRRDVTFATPRYCQTRTCGPVVDVVGAVREEYEPQGVRFIHVEIFEVSFEGTLSVRELGEAVERHLVAAD